MKLILVFLFSLASTSSVVSLRQQDIDHFIKEVDYSLVFFYEEHCDFCDHTLPLMEELSAAFKDNSELHFAKCEVTNEKEMNKSIPIRGFPTLILFKKQVHIDYQGKLEFDSIKAFIEEKLNSKIIVYEDGPKCKEEVVKHPVSLLFIGDHGYAFDIFLDYSEFGDDIYFAHCISEQCKEEFKVEDAYQVQIYNTEADEFTPLTETLDYHNLHEFVGRFGSPLVSIFDEFVAEMVFRSNIPGFFYYYTEEDTKIIQVLEKVALDFRHEIMFVKVNFETELERELASFQQVSEEEVPVFKIHHVSAENHKNYLFKAELTEENLRTFLFEWKQGKLKRDLKSAPIPTENQGLVKEIVAENFEDVIFDKTKDILVLFYTPWCDLCMEISAELEKMAERMDRDLFLFAAMDISKNELDILEIRETPGIGLFTATDNKIEMMQDDYSLEKLISFIEKAATNPFKLGE